MFYCSVGCHPTRCTEYTEGDPEVYQQTLLDLVVSNTDKVVAIGECGLGRSLYSSGRRRVWTR
jgi:TatD DNase family protein